MYNRKSGDKVINRYTDAFIEMLRKGLKLPFDCEIYGGSSYMEYREAYIGANIKLPLIVVVNNIRFKDSCIEYQLWNQEGNSKTFLYDLSAMAIDFSPTVYVLEESQAQYDEIESQMRSLFSQEQIVVIPCKGENFQGYYNRVKFVIDDGCPVEHMLIEETSPLVSMKNVPEIYSNIRVSKIKFRDFENVYFAEDYDESEIEGNQRLQLRMLQQASFCAKKAKALMEPRPLKSSWKALMNERKKGKYLDKINNLLDKVSYTDEFRELMEKNIATGKMDMVLFEKAMKEEIEIYPQLYWAAVERISSSELMQRVEDASNKYQERCDLLCNQLSIPNTPFKQDDTVFIDESIAKSLRDSVCLDEFIRDMEDEDISIPSLIPKVKALLSEETTKYLRQREENMEMIKGVNSALKTAGGIAAAGLASHNAKKAEKEAAKKTEESASKPYLGTRPMASCGFSCPYRRKEPKGYGLGRYCKFDWDPATCKARGGEPIIV